MFFETGLAEAVSKLRWKQVKILHGPATVMKEFCSGYATAKDEAIAETTWEGEQSIDI